MSTGFQPLGNRVLIKEDKAAEKTAGGLIIPDADQTKSLTGEILEVGEDSTLKVGQKVMFTEHAGLEVKVNFKKYLLIRQTELLGVLTEK